MDEVIMASDGTHKKGAVGGIRKGLSVLECEIRVYRTSDVRIDETALQEILIRKRKETLTEISSLVRL